MANTDDVYQINTSVNPFPLLIPKSSGGNTTIATYADQPTMLATAPTPSLGITLDTNTLWCVFSNVLAVPIVTTP